MPGRPAVVHTFHFPDCSWFIKSLQFCFLTTFFFRRISAFKVDCFKLQNTRLCQFTKISLKKRLNATTFFSASSVWFKLRLRRWHTDITRAWFLRKTIPSRVKFFTNHISSKIPSAWSKFHQFSHLQRLLYLVDWSLSDQHSDKFL